MTTMQHWQSYWNRPGTNFVLACNPTTRTRSMWYVGLRPTGGNGICVGGKLPIREPGDEASTQEPKRKVASQLYTCTALSPTVADRPGSDAQDPFPETSTLMQNAWDSLISRSNHAHMQNSVNLTQNFYTRLTCEKLHPQEGKHARSISCLGIV